MVLRVLVTAPYFLPALERYRARLAEHGIEPVPVAVEQALREDDLVPLVRDVEGIVCGDDDVTARVLEAAPRLRVIAKWGTGIDSIDREAAARRGVLVVNTPGAFDDPVADTVVGYMLCFARNLPWMDRDVRAGLWRKRPGFALAERTLGLVGVGRIGRAVARRASAFGMRVVGTDPAEAARSLAAAEGIELASLDQVLTTADFVSLHVALDAASYHLIGERELGLMKPGIYLINTARGRLVDELALVAALERGSLAGAALDVFEEEPLPPGSPLRRLDNVLLAPHNANSSPAAWERVHESTVTQLIDGLTSRR